MRRELINWHSQPPTKHYPCEVCKQGRARWFAYLKDGCLDLNLPVCDSCAVLEDADLLAKYKKGGRGK